MRLLTQRQEPDRAHHVVPILKTGGIQTVPLKGFVMLCANCHRLVHRKRSICLRLHELKQHRKNAASLP
ncbi:HNH endonuclease [Paracoccus sp. 1_MG-2023]|uniref:HNH endonuclease n=1 Tax=Paracoccus sp. 1_MG-2023 TaxID=3062651 RepID=UPI0034C5B92D